MKTAEWYLKKPEAITVNMQDRIEIPAGTLVFPFWNETLIPEHRRDELKEAQRYERKEKMVMCIIGIAWLPVRASNIFKK